MSATGRPRSPLTSYPHYARLQSGGGIDMRALQNAGFVSGSLRSLLPHPAHSRLAALCSQLEIGLVVAEGRMQKQQRRSGSELALASVG
jgi:hypothetical protein